jgi:Secretion system C-terminal sorting domain
MKNYLIFLFLFLSFKANSQNWDWVQTINGGGNNYVWDATTDSQNNVIICGRVKFDVTFADGGTAQFSTQLGIQTDIYVAKFSANGDLLWYRRSGNVNPDWARSVTVDQNDYIYVTGDFVNMAVFENDTIYGYNNGQTDPNLMARSGFLAKYEPDGDLVWAKSFQATGHTRGYGVSIANNFDIYLSGYSTGICDFGNGVTSGDVVEDVGFVAKYDSSGTAIWANTFESPFASRANDVIVVNDTTIAITGYYNSSLTYNGNMTPGDSPSWGDFFILVADNDGVFKWVRTGTGPFLNEGHQIAVDNQSNMYIVGRFSFTMDIASVQQTAIGVGTNTTEYIQNGDAFLVKYDINGNQEWFNQIGNDVSDDFESVVICDSLVLIHGKSIDTITFSGSSDSLIPEVGNHNSMLIAYSVDGSYNWSHIVASTATQVADNYSLVSGNAGIALTADNLGNIYAGGYFNETSHWDSSTITSVSSYDAYIAKLFPPLNPKYSASSLSLCPGDTANFSILQKGSPLTYTWTSQIGGVLNQTNNGVSLLYATAGVDTLIGLVSNAYETDSIVLYINVSTTNCLGIVSEIASSFELYPNPVNSSITLTSDRLHDSAKYLIFNSVGERVIDGLITDQNTFINMESLNPGMYYITIVLSDNTTIVKKLMKL